jgi:hypothetical protein
MSVWTAFILGGIGFCCICPTLSLQDVYFIFQTLWDEVYVVNAQECHHGSYLEALDAKKQKFEKPCIIKCKQGKFNPVVSKNNNHTILYGYYCELHFCKLIHSRDCSLHN